MSDEHRSLWREFEPRLRALGAALAGSLTEDQRWWYTEYLDAHELRLALEILATWLSEVRMPLRDVDRTEMLALGRAMGSEPQLATTLRRCPRAP